MTKDDKTKSKRLYDTYGITLEEYREMYKQAEGKCYICQREYPVLNVDHRHIPKYKDLPPEEKKKEVRGLLCMRCNKFTVGSLEIHKKAREILHRLIQYFKLFKLKGDV